MRLRCEEFVFTEKTENKIKIFFLNFFHFEAKSHSKCATIIILFFSQRQSQKISTPIAICLLIKTLKSKSRWLIYEGIYTFVGFGWKEGKQKSKDYSTRHTSYRRQRLCSDFLSQFSKPNESPDRKINIFGQHELKYNICHEYVYSWVQDIYQHKSVNHSWHVNLMDFFSPLRTLFWWGSLFAHFKYLHNVCCVREKQNFSYFLFMKPHKSQ